MASCFIDKYLTHFLHLCEEWRNETAMSLLLASTIPQLTADRLPDLIEEEFSHESTG
jgi:hypothetical protein